MLPRNGFSATGSNTTSFSTKESTIQIEEDEGKITFIFEPRLSVDLDSVLVLGTIQYNIMRDDDVEQRALQYMVGLLPLSVD
jgi:hypothetical protein